MVRGRAALAGLPTVRSDEPVGATRSSKAYRAGVLVTSVRRCLAGHVNGRFHGQAPCAKSLRTARAHSSFDNGRFAISVSTVPDSVPRSPNSPDSFRLLRSVRFLPG